MSTSVSLAPAWFLVVGFGVLLLLVVGGAVLAFGVLRDDRYAPLRWVIGGLLALVLAIPLLGALAFVGLSARRPTQAFRVQTSYIETSEMERAQAEVLRLQAEHARAQALADSQARAQAEALRRPPIVVSPETPSPSGVNRTADNPVPEVSSATALADDGPVSALTVLQSATTLPPQQPLAIAPPATVASIPDPQRPVTPAVASINPTPAAPAFPVPEPAAPAAGTEDRTVSTTGPLPAWAVTNRGAAHSGSDTFVQVVVSQQFATEHEARDDARRLVREQLLYDMRRGGWLRTPPSPSYQPSEAIVTAAAHRTHVETLQRDFGSFFAPMYRVWHEVEVGPTVRSMLLSELRVNQAESRRWVVLVGVGLIFCLPLAIVLQGWAGRRYPFGGRWLVLGVVVLGALFLVRWTRSPPAALAPVDTPHSTDENHR